jgi:hypothetical protein
VSELVSRLVWDRPWALAAILVPLVVLWLARFRPRLLARASGAQSLWAELARAEDNQRRAGARIPPALWWTAAGMVVGAAALAGPRLAPAQGVQSLRIVVDRSPSMYLPLAGTTRLEHALARTLALVDGDDPGWSARERVWISADEPLARAPRPPDAWLRAPRIPQAEPYFAAEDRAGTVWLTDQAPNPPPAHAGYVASGGPAVVGPVDTRGTTRIDWDGVSLVEVVSGAPPRHVVIAGALPELVQQALRAWCAARELECSSASVPDPALVVRTQSDDGSARELPVARDGWSARAHVRGAARTRDEDGALEVWLEGDAGPERVPLVTCAPGRIELARMELELPSGDPALFPVSWAALFDRVLLPASGAVALSERRAAGTGSARAPTRDAGRENGADPVPLVSALVLASAVCVAIALGLVLGSALPRTGRAASQ